MTNRLQMFFLLLCLVSISLFSACSVLTKHKVAINQGNVLDKHQIAKIKLGMTRTEIVQLLGNPVINNIFHRDTWSYINYTSKNRYHLQLTFKEDLLVKIKPIDEVALKALP